MSVRAAVAILAFASLAAGSASAQDAAAGAKVFKRCAACHAVGPDAADKAGPHLNGLLGRKIAGVEGFGYSDAMKAFGDGKTWDDATIDKWFEAPSTVVPGTSMAFAGLKKPEDRANLAAYLATFDATGATK